MGSQVKPGSRSEQPIQAAPDIAALEREARAPHHQHGGFDGLLTMDPLFLGERMGEIEDRFLQLSPLIADLNQELFNNNPEKFHTDSIVAQTQIADLRALLVGAPVFVETQYPQYEFFQLVKLWFKSFRSRGVWSDAREKMRMRKVHLQVLAGYEGLCREYLKKIEDIKLSPYRNRQAEIMRHNHALAPLLGKLHTARVQLESEEAQDYMTRVSRAAVIARLREEVRSLSERKNRIEQEALWQAMEEMKK